MMLPKRHYIVVGRRVSLSPFCGMPKESSKSMSEFGALFTYSQTIDQNPCYGDHTKRLLISGTLLKMPQQLRVVWLNRSLSRLDASNIHVFVVDLM